MKSSYIIYRYNTCIGYAGTFLKVSSTLYFLKLWPLCIQLSYCRTLLQLIMI